MSADDLLNSLNELGKRVKMQGLPSILSLFRNKFNKFNNTKARLLDSIFHMTLEILNKHIFGMKTSRVWHHLSNDIMEVITLHTNL